ncbi:MAG: hypothetical protein ACI8XO_001993 [Verrucomicrobiales bacterium]|jgi:hypothetical protein
MNRRQALAALAASTLSTQLLAAPSASGSSKKKGWAGGNKELHKLFRAKWYYTWSPKTHTNDAIEFVPMIKKAGSLKQRAAVEKMSGAKFLLGFNEPERKKQGNISIADAIKLWPQLVEIAVKKKIPLGSPAPSSNKAGLAWLEEFMDQAKRKKLRIDFVALHWYKSRKASEFESFVKGMAREYRKPIWITEFNGWAGPESENYKFLRDSLKFLERNKDVRRYAYFNVAKGKPLSLLDKDGKPSRMGEIYRDA